MSVEVKARTLKVISVCSECGEPVCATKYDKAVRHGFERFKTRMIAHGKRFSQEDNKPCAGTGQEVVYKRYKQLKKMKK